MKIRSKIILQFLLINSIIFLISNITIYIISSDFRQSEFYLRLSNKALTTGKLLIDVAEIDAKLLKIIDETSYITLPEECVAIYSDEKKILYSSVPEDKIRFTQTDLHNLDSLKVLQFTRDDFQFYGKKYDSKGNNFYIFASAIDRFGLSKQANLKTVLIIAYIISCFLSVALGFFYSGEILKPINKILFQTEKITINSLAQRLTESKNKDEISKLILTINSMLERLENSFKVQKSFIANASHEMRTPLAVILSELEITLLKERKSEEYKEIIKSLRKEIFDLSVTANSLLLLAQNESNVEVEQSIIRIDEQIIDIVQIFKEGNQENIIDLQYLVFPELDTEYQVNGNEVLLKVLFRNLIDNGLKFSPDKKCRIELNRNNDFIIVKIINSGEMIPKEDQTKIFEPFFRSNQSIIARGHGLGLAMVKRIIDLHGFSIAYHYAYEENQFVITLNK